MFISISTLIIVGIIILILFAIIYGACKSCIEDFNRLSFKHDVITEQLNHANDKLYARDPLIFD